jgi:hypothetical protein
MLLVLVCKIKNRFNMLIIQKPKNCQMLYWSQFWSDNFQTWYAVRVDKCASHYPILKPKFGNFNKNKIKVTKSKKLILDLENSK